MSAESRNVRPLKAWIVLGCALAFSFVFNITDRTQIVVTPGYFLPILVAYMASRAGNRMVVVLLGFGLVAAFDVHLSLGAIRLSLRIPDQAYLVSVLAACAFSNGRTPISLIDWLQPWWRGALWTILGLLALCGFMDLGLQLKTDFIRMRWVAGAIVGLLVVLASVRWSKVVTQWRSSYHFSDVWRTSRTMIVLATGCILIAALLVSIRLPWIGDISIRFGLAGHWDWLIVACFAATAFGLLDWRALVAMLIIVFAAEWIFAKVWLIVPGRSGGDVHSLLAAWVHSDAPRVPLLTSALSAALFGRAIQPFWLRRDIEALQERQTLWLLAAVLSIEFIILPVVSQGMSVSSQRMLLGGMTFVAGLIWRRNALVSAPLTIMLCYMIGVFGFTERGVWWAAREMGVFGMLAFPFVFFGVLVGERMRQFPTADGALHTVDLTPLARLVRDLDVSATLKAFVAVLAPLFVINNLKAILSFALQFIDMGFDFIDSEELLIGAGFLLIVVLAALAPFGFLLTDWIARKEAGRYLSAISGAGLGLLGILAVAQAFGTSTFLLDDLEWAPFEAGRWMLSGAIALVLAVILGRMLARSKRLRLVLLSVLVLPIIALLVAVVYQTIASLEGPDDYQELAGVLLGMILVAITIGMIVRGVRLRLLLSGTRPRPLLFGDLRGGLWVRLAFLVGLPSSMWRLSAMRRPSFWLFLFSRPLVYVGAVVVIHNLQRWGLVPALGLGLLLVVAGHLAFLGAKRLAAREVWRPEQRDDARPPVLFLRSFEDDQFDFKRPAWDILGRWFDLWSLRSNADQALIDEVAQYGPVVALGRPGETRAPFGALRHYATDDEWQSVIADTARRAQAIIIAASDSEGVLWEYDLLRREGLIDRTLLLFRPVAEDGATNRRALEAFSTGGKAATDAADGRRMVALLQTESGPAMLTVRRNIAGAYVAAIRAHFQKCPVRALGDPADLFAVVA